MKITKSRLKRIIKEELEVTLLEGFISDPEEQKQRAKKFYQQIERLLYDYGQEFRSPNQIADAIVYAASKKGVKELGEPGMPSKENKFDGTRGAATALNNFMENQDPKLVLAALYKAFIHTKTKKQDMVQYGKQRSKREYDAFAKFSRAGGNVKDLNKPKRRKFLTRSVELVNEEEPGNIKEGPQRAFCIGYEKDGKRKHQTVHADAAGIAERKIKREHNVRDSAIKSTKEGKCKGHA